MLNGFFGWVVPFQIMVAVGKVYVGFVEDGGPLEGGGWLFVVLAELGSCPLQIQNHILHKWIAGNLPCCV